MGKKSFITCRLDVIVTNDEEHKQIPGEIAYVSIESMDDDTLTFSVGIANDIEPINAYCMARILKIVENNLEVDKDGDIAFTKKVYFKASLIDEDIPENTVMIINFDSPEPTVRIHQDAENDESCMRFLKEVIGLVSETYSQKSMSLNE